MRGRKGFGIFLALAIGAGVFGWMERDAIQVQLFTRAVEKQASRNGMAALDPKALHVAFCGTGAPLPSRERAAACTAIIAGGRIFIFDMGDGAAEINHGNLLP